MVPPTNNASDYSAPPTYRVAAVPPVQRPLGVAVLAILKFLSAVLAVAVIWFYQNEITTRFTFRVGGPPARIGPYDLSAGLNAMMDDVYAGSVRRLRIAQILTALDMPLALAVAWGLWKMRPWARLWSIGLAFLSIALGILATGLAVQLSAPLGVMINGFVIWYLRRDNVRAAFGSS
jgi:hypothetical protein